MDWAQVIVSLFGGGVVGTVGNNVFQQWRSTRNEKVAEKRQYIDRLSTAERKVRMLQESLALHRRMMIDTPGFDPATLPEWPQTSGNTNKETP